VRTTRWAEPIGKILSDVIRDLGLSKKLSEQRAVVEWPDIVGRRVAEHARAVRVDGGRLLVEVDSPVWSQELTLMKRNILREINDRIGRKAIDNVHFVLGGARPHGASGNSGDKEEVNGEG
jgi:predicted nucleic acid-binding Zn ribbon protein